jgi:hypothetical protein
VVRLTCSISSSVQTARTICISISSSGARHHHSTPLHPMARPIPLPTRLVPGCGPVSLVHSLGPLCNTFCTRRTPHVPSVRPLPPEPSRLTHLRCFRSETLYHPVRTTGQQSLCPHATPQGPGLGPVLQPPRSHGAHCQCYTTSPFPALHPHTTDPPHSGRGPHHTTHPFDVDHAYLKTLRSGTSAFVKLQTHHPLFEHLLPPAPPPPPSTPASHPNPYMRPPPPSRTGILGHWPRSPLHPPPLPRLPALFIVATHPPLQQTPSANPHRLPTRTPHRHPLLHPPIALHPVRSASGGQIQPLVFNHLSV